MPDNADPLADNGSNVPDKASNVPDKGSNGPNKANNVPNKGSNVPNKGSKVPDKGSNVPANASNVPDESIKKQRRRQRRKKKAKKDTQDTNPVGIGDQQKTQSSGDHASSSATVGRRNTKKRRPRVSRFDRYYGRFRCRICRRSWDSAHVFTVAGTKKVIWKQRCMKCNSDDAWMNPIALELLRCSVCHSTVCECLCDECNKLKHLRYVNIEIQGDDGDVKKVKGRTVDDRFEYCDCPENQRRSKRQVGANSDLKKPHLAHLCQKCIQGFPCAGARSAENDDPDDECPEDNEP